MRAFLADTQLLVWYAEDDGELPKAAAKRMQDETNVVYFSLVSIWEAAIKFALGRPDFTLHPRNLRNGLLQAGFLELPILPEHVVAVSRLAPFHRDPFDRLLIAQADLEGLTLMTTDKKLAQYGPFVQRY